MHEHLEALYFFFLYNREAERQVAAIYAVKILLWLRCIDYLRPGKAICKERLLTIGSFGMLHLHRSPIY